MGKITDVTYDKQYIEIAVDGVRYARMTKSEFRQIQLSVGDHIDEAALTERLNAIQLPRAYEAALSILDRRDVTVKGMQTALARRVFHTDVISAVIQRLTENGLLDDNRFAERYVETHAGGAYGQYAIRQKLLAKGIDSETASDALSELDEIVQLEGAVARAEKLKQRYAGASAYEKRGKIAQALSRRGYAWDIIEQALGNIDLDDES